MLIPPFLRLPEDNETGVKTTPEAVRSRVRFKSPARIRREHTTPLLSTV